MGEAAGRVNGAHHILPGGSGQGPLRCRMATVASPRRIGASRTTRAPAVRRPLSRIYANHLARIALSRPRPGHVFCLAIGTSLLCESSSETHTAARMGNLLTTTLAVAWSYAMLLAAIVPVLRTADAAGATADTQSACRLGRDHDHGSVGERANIYVALDARTSAAELWLRFGQAGAELLRPIDWDRVVSAEVAGHKFTGEELRQLIDAIRQEIPAEPVSPPAKSEYRDGRAARILRKRSRNRQRLPPTPRVVSLAIDARAGRWDENVEPDGLVVHVYPLDADGAIVPVRGTLNVDLKAERQDEHRLQEPFLDAGHWTQSVPLADFGPSGGGLSFAISERPPGVRAGGVESAGSLARRRSRHAWPCPDRARLKPPTTWPSPSNSSSSATTWKRSLATAIFPAIATSATSAPTTAGDKRLGPLLCCRMCRDTADQTRRRRQAYASRPMAPMPRRRKVEGSGMMRAKTVPLFVGPPCSVVP